MTNAPGVNGVAFSPDGHWLATSGATTPIWDTRSGKELLRVTHEWCIGVAFSPDGHWLATGGSDVVRIWDTRSGKELLQVTHEWCTGVAFSPDGHLLATGGLDKTARVWQLR